MRFSASGDRSWFLPLRVLGVAGSVLLVAAVAIGVALAAPAAKRFHAEMTQTAQTTYAFTLENRSDNVSLGSANVALPTAFTNVSVPALVGITPAGKTWTSRINAGAIELRAADTKSALTPGEWITLEITADAPCGTGYTAGVRVKQSNNFSGPPGNDLAGLDPVFDVIGPAVRFAFGTILSPKLVGTEFTVGLTAKDACEQDAEFYGGTPDLAGLDTAPNGTAPGYQLSGFSAGVAEAKVTPAIAQFDAVLTATDSVAGISGNSDEFYVVTKLCQTGGDTCVAEDGLGTTLSANPPPQGAKLELSLLRRGQAFTCGGTPRTAIGSLGNIAPEDFDKVGATDPIQVTGAWTLPSGAGNPTLCISESKEFDAGDFVPVPTCARTNPDPPCELSRSRSPGTLQVVLLIDPVDPWVGLG